MRILQRFVLCVILTVVCIRAIAQAGKLFTADRELSSSMINRIYQDRDGVIWIATEDGLNRYDGARFLTLRHETGNDQSLSNNYVNDVFEDSKGHLYISTMDGLNIYDRARGVFKRVPLRSPEGTAYHANVQMVTERRDGSVLVAAQGYGGLYTLKFEGDSIHTCNIPLNFDSHMVNLAYEDRNGGLWLSAIDLGLYRYRGKRFVPVGGMGGTNFNTLCEDGHGRLYAGSMTGGLFVQDRPDGPFRRISSGIIPSLNIKAMLPDGRGNILIGTDGQGLKLYNTATGTVTDMPLNTTEIGVDHSKIHSILRDRNGDLWLGSYQKGVLLLPMFTSGFRLTGYRSVTSRLDGSACVMSIMRTRGGTMIIGTDGDGIYCIERNGHMRHFRPSAAANGVPQTVMALFEDSRGAIYIVSYLQGMARFNPETGACTYIKTLKNLYGRPVRAVYSFAEDRAGRIWIGSNGDGLLCFDPETGECKDWSIMSGKSNRLYNRWVNKVLITADGNIWVAAFGGMSRLDPKRRSWLTINGKNRLLPDEVIYTLYEDKRHNIWAGTLTGLILIDTKNKSTRKLTMRDGLPSNMITAILPDKRGGLWLSTSHGLSRLDTRTMKFVNYYADDGLQGNEFSKNAAFADGELMFGGTNGVTVFNPTQIKIPSRRPQVRIAAMYIHDQRVTVGMKSGLSCITEQEPMKSDRFTLAHNDNSFSLEFTAMEFYNPLRISYSYSINNGPQTTLAPGVNRLSSSGLRPGRYRFRVRSCDYGIFSAPLEFTVIIRPAWYASWPAYIIYVLIIAGAAWYASRLMRRRYRLRRQMQEHIYQEQVKEAKLQFFINVSHEIRTPMQLIISPLQKLIDTDADPARQGQYGMIMRNASRILRLINQLMDMRKIDKGQMRLRFCLTDINSFVADVCKAFEFQMQRRGITFTFVQAAKDVKAYIDPQNFDKVLVNLLSNALKFTPAEGKITVTLSVSDEEDGTFRLTVSDTGIGIDPAKKELIFERFYQINNSVTTSTTGTGVGLHLVRQLVTLHHGTIEVNNNTPERGCTFTITVPLGREHLDDSDIEQGDAITQTVTENRTEAFDEQTQDIENDSATRPKTRYRILLAEDDEEIRTYVSAELSQEFHVTACADGTQAWDEIRRNSYDLLVSDIMMPGIDGLNLCRKVKQNIHTNTVPVILLTAKTLESEQIKGLDTGADAYITKPFSIDFLKTRINNLLRNRSLLRTIFEGKQEPDVDVSAMQEESPNDKLMRRVMKVINDNISDPQLNVDQISREVGISRVHLYRKLKELTNQSARDFLRNVRLRHAAELLRQGNSNVSRIAELTGFSSIAVFSHAFKELYGVSPTEYAASKQQPL